jgi:hypothetical protein
MSFDRTFFGAAFDYSAADAAAVAVVSVNPAPRAPPVTTTPALFRKFLRLSPLPSLLLISSSAMLGLLDILSS